MAVQQQIWQQVIMNNMYAKWDALAQMSTDDHVYMRHIPGVAYKVHIPQAGTVSDVVINPSSYPLVVETRTDEVLEYTLDNIAVKPIHLEKFNSDTLSYNDMQSILVDHTGRIGEAQLYKSFINWYIGKRTGKFVETTGATNAVSDAPGSTQNAKVMILADLRKASEILDKQNVPDDGRRFAALPTQMFYQLLAAVEDGTHNINLIEKDGLVMLEKPLYGIKILKFNRVCSVETSTYNVRAYNHAGATTDRHAGLVFHKDFISIAKGPMNVYYDSKSPTYQGDVVSANAYLGGSYRRKDYVGVVPIVQTNA
jgi:hypothetical protein